MAREFKETAHLKTDKKTFSDNFDAANLRSSIKDSGSYVVRDGELVKLSDIEATKFKKHKTAGLCGEYGMSEQTSRGGFGEGIVHKDPDRFPCEACGYQENRFKDFCENCLDKKETK